MTVKYRLNFVMSADTLFGLLARVLPIEELSVEEIAPTPVRTLRVERLPKPKPKPQPQRARRVSGYAANLEAGTNAAILKVLADGQTHRTREIKDAFLAAGYNPNGTGSSISRQQKWGLIETAGPGQWRLTKEYKQKLSA